MAAKISWKQRAEKAGLDQKTLGTLLGLHPVTIYRQLKGTGERGTPHYIRAAIMAWEIMDEAQRKKWLSRALQEFVFED